MSHMLQKILFFCSLDLCVWHSLVNYQFASPLIWLIRTSIKCLFLRDTSSSALALGVSRPYRNASPFTRLIERAQEIWNFRCRFYTRQILSRCQNLFMLTRKRAEHRLEWCWRGSAILQKDFALGNQTESLK